MSARLAIVVVAEFQSASSTGQDDRLSTTLFDKPLLIGISGTEFPTEHFAFVLTVVAVIECDTGIWTVEAPIALPFGLHNAPNLCLRFFVDGGEGDGAILVVESKAVANLETVALIGVIVLRHKAKGACKKRGKQHGEESSSHNSGSFGV